MVGYDASFSEAFEAPSMSYRIDEIDKRILYHLAVDARNTTAPTIAEEVDVSPGTIRNRVEQLEDHGIITGYHAAIDYERVEGRLTNLYVCTAPVTERAKIATQALAVSGVVDVRELQAGQRNVHVVGVGSDTDDLSRISNELATLGLSIDEEHLVQNQQSHPYHPFDPDNGHRRAELTDFISLTGGAEMIETTVGAEMPIVNCTLAEANDRSLLDDDVLVVGIERDGVVLTPDGETELRAGDVVTLFSREELDVDDIAGFDLG
jgi:DNA-binding Lrp family transcriptional regulator